MTKQYFLLDENVTGDVIFYEGDTVVFEVDATNYYRHWSDRNYYQPGDDFGLFASINNTST